MDAQHDRVGAAAVTFASTEHFNLQTARAATIAEANGRALGFLAVLSSSLIALGFIGQMSKLGTGFYAFALVLLPAVAAIGTVTFERLVQLMNEDIAYARRIARIRSFYVETAPELRPYLAVVPERDVPLEPSARQLLLTIAGVIAFVNSGIVGAAAGLAASAGLAANLTGSLAVGTPVAALSLAAYLQRQRRLRTESRRETIDAFAVAVPA